MEGVLWENYLVVLILCTTILNNIYYTDTISSRIWQAIAILDVFHLGTRCDWLRLDWVAVAGFGVGELQIVVLELDGWQSDARGRLRARRLILASLLILIRLRQSIPRPRKSNHPARLLIGPFI